MRPSRSTQNTRPSGATWMNSGSLASVLSTSYSTPEANLNGDWAWAVVAGSRATASEARATARERECIQINTHARARVPTSRSGISADVAQLGGDVARQGDPRGQKARDGQQGERAAGHGGDADPVDGERELGEAEGEQ